MRYRLSTEQAEAITLVIWTIKVTSSSGNGHNVASESEVQKVLAKMGMATLLGKAWGAVKQSGYPYLEKYDNVFIRFKRKEKVVMIKFNQQFLDTMPLGVTFNLAVNDAEEGLLPQGFKEIREYFVYAEAVALPKEDIPSDDMRIERIRQKMGRGRNRPAQSKPKHENKLNRINGNEEKVLDAIRMYVGGGAYQYMIQRDTGLNGGLEDALDKLHYQGLIKIMVRGKTAADDIYVAAEYA